MNEFSRCKLFQHKFLDQEFAKPNRKKKEMQKFTPLFFFSSVFAT